MNPPRPRTYTPAGGGVSRPIVGTSNTTSTLGTNLSHRQFVTSDEGRDRKRSGASETHPPTCPPKKTKQENIQGPAGEIPEAPPTMTEENGTTMEDCMEGDPDSEVLNDEETRELINSSYNKTKTQDGPPPNPKFT